MNASQLHSWVLRNITHTTYGPMIPPLEVVPEHGV